MNMRDEKYVQLIPVVGYWATYVEEQEPHRELVKRSYPIIALALQADGDVVYLVHDEDGHPQAAHQSINFLEISLGRAYQGVPVTFSELPEESRVWAHFKGRYDGSSKI